MRNVIKSLLSVLLVCFLSTQLFAVDGTVTFVKGKVEVKRGGDWISLKVGDKVAQSEVINTGFQSEAKVKLMDSVLYLGPVTRVSLDQLASSSDRDKVNVYLTTGTVRSKVNRTNNKSVSYTVRTPIAVASVRGTDFSADARGNYVTNQGTISAGSNQEAEGRQRKKLRKEKGDDESNDGKNKLAEDDYNFVEDSEALPDLMLVNAGQGVNVNDMRKFGTAKPQSVSNVMNLVTSVATEDSKYSSSQAGSGKSVANIVNNVINNGIISSPKTGSIKVQISEPQTGNVSVEVVVPGK